MTPKHNSLILLMLLIAGCKQMPQVSMPTLPGLGAYQIDIQQGNVVTQEMLDKLQPGMTRSQVRFVLGTPLLVDPFRTDRWDYVFTLDKKGDRIEQRQLRVFFQDDKMVRYEGDVIAEPGTNPVVAAKTAAAKPVEKPAVAPVTKPEPTPPPVAAPVVSKPAPEPEIAKPTAPSLPAREPVADTGKPQLQMAPNPGERARPEDLKPQAPVAAKPSEPESLDAPPLPRLILPPEQPEQSLPPSAFAATTEPVAKPAVAPVAGKPAAKPAEKPAAATGFFGRMFGGSPRSTPPDASPVAKPSEPVKPVAAPAPAVVAAPAPPPVEKPVVAKPEVKPAAKPQAVTQKPADKPSAAPGFFGRMLDGLRNPAPPIVGPGAVREAQPGSPPPPFVDPDPTPTGTKP